MVHVAVDIGASSGRLILGELIQRKIEVKEVYRFQNGFTSKNGYLFWDIDYLLGEILTGLQLVKEAGYNECTLGIDTWAIDYVLLDKDGNRVREVISYRDSRTEKTIDKVTKNKTKVDIYNITGIQFLPFNTLYQLYEEEEHILAATKHILMVPDYLNYRLTGKMKTETTNASTTQLLNVRERMFDEELVKETGFKTDRFPEFVEPGNILGNVNNEWFSDFSLPKCKVINVASHDTASAVVGTPSTVDNWAYLSSGTWSLLGIEIHEPIINNLALEGKYTNEWGAFHSFRFLKNITGMWIIQEVQKLLSESYDANYLVKVAQGVKRFQQFIDFNDERFLNPENMITEIQVYCRETNQIIPYSPGELAASVFNNLAIIYAIAMEEIECITNKRIDRLYIVGGGGRNNFLNQLTADLSNKSVFIGPAEATAIGNIIVQMIAVGRITNITDGRKLIEDSFTMKRFFPNEINRIEIINQFKKTIRSKVRR